MPRRQSKRKLTVVRRETDGGGSGGVGEEETAIGDAKRGRLSDDEEMEIDHDCKNSSTDSTQTIVVDLQRLLHTMEQTTTTTTTAAAAGVSWQDVLTRADLAQSLFQQVVITMPTTTDPQQMKDLEHRVQAAIQKAKEQASELQSQEKEKEENNPIDKIFGSTNLKQQQQQQHHESETNTLLTDNSNHSEEEGEEDDLNQDTPVKAPPTTTTSVKQQQQQQPDLSSTSRSNKIADLQSEQRDQIESAIAQMASQMKKQTAAIHSTIKQQNETLLDDMQQVAEENVEAVKDLASDVQEHTRQSWKRSVGTWMTLLTVVGMFVFGLITIFMIPKAQTGDVPCLFFCPPAEEQFCRILANGQRECIPVPKEQEPTKDDDTTEEEHWQETEVEEDYDEYSMENDTYSDDQEEEMIHEDDTKEEEIQEEEELNPKENEEGDIEEEEIAAVVEEIAAVEEDIEEVGDDDMEEDVVDGEEIDTDKEEEQEVEENVARLEEEIREPNEQEMNEIPTKDVPAESIETVESESDFQSEKEEEEEIPNDGDIENTKTNEMDEGGDQVVAQDDTVEKTTDEEAIAEKDEEEKVVDEEEEEEDETQAEEENEVVKEEEDVEAEAEEEQSAHPIQKGSAVEHQYDDDLEQIPYISPTSFQLKHVALAVINGDMMLLKAYIKSNPSLLNSQDANGWAPIHEATARGLTEVVEYLIRRGADLNLRTFAGMQTPLEIALERFTPAHPTVQALQKAVGLGSQQDGKKSYVELGPDGQPIKEDSLPRIQVPTRVNMDDILKEYEESKSGEPSPSAPVKKAKRANKDEIFGEKADVPTQAQIPIYKGRPFSSKDVRQVAAQDDPETLDAYLTIGPKYLNDQDRNGWTALHIAVNAGQLEQVKVLLEHGADMSLLTHQTKNTALDIAYHKFGGQHPITELLEDHEDEAY